MRRRAAGLILGAAALVLAMPSTQAAADNYGAIAYSPSSRVWGYSYDYRSRGEAERQAMARCEAMDCIIAIWFRNACGALANGPDGYGSAWGPTRGAAEANAIRECGDHSSGCATAVWTCTSR